MKKVLITGITGFAGSHLAEYLLSKNSYTIWGIHSSTRNLDNIKAIQDNITLIQLDLSDAEETATAIAEIKPDVIFHLAASASVIKSFENPLEVLMNNTASELNILEGVKKAGLTKTKIIIVSSAQVYGFVTPDELPVTEQALFKPDNAYAVSKITQEYLALQYFYAYKLPIIRMRPFNHLGSRMSPMLSVSRFAKMIAEIEKGKVEPVLRVGNMSSKRDFTDVRDIVRAYVLAEDKGQVGDVYNVGTGKSYSMQDILDKLLSLATVKIAVETDQSLFRPSDIPELRCDASKLMKQTGWKPEIMLEQSLKDTLDYWRSKNEEN